MSGDQWNKTRDLLPPDRKPQGRRPVKSNRFRIWTLKGAWEQVFLYTGIEIQNLLIRSDYEIEISKYTIFGQPNSEEDKMIDLLVSFMKIPSKEAFLAYQYIFKAVKR